MTDTHNLARDKLLDVINELGYTTDGRDVLKALDAYDAARIPDRDALARLLFEEFKYHDIYEWDKQPPSTKNKYRGKADAVIALLKENNA